VSSVSDGAESHEEDVSAGDGERARDPASPAGREVDGPASGRDERRCRMSYLYTLAWSGTPSDEACTR
jgi:hypothetical protein